MFDIRQLFGWAAALTLATACGGTAGNAAGTMISDASAPPPTYAGTFAVGTCTETSISPNTSLSTMALTSSGCFGETFGGRAVAAGATLLGDLAEVVVSDTGELPSTGGSIAGALVDAKLDGVLTASAASSSVRSATAATDGHAEIAKVRLGLAGLDVSADVLASDAVASCTASGAAFSGTSTITNLVVAGLPITVDGTPNQTIDIRGILRLVINEQRVDATGLTVSALHVSVLSVLEAADVTIARSRANISCACAGDDDDDDAHYDSAPPPPSSSSSSSSGSPAPAGGGVGDPCDDSRPCGTGLTCATGGPLVVR